MPRLTILLTALIACLALSGCASTVEPIDLYDETIPVQARQIVADAQDAVAIAEAHRDSAARHLSELERWRDDKVSSERWPADAQGLLGALSNYADARVAMAALELERTEAEVALARANRELLTAKTAIRHDLAVYDLAPLRETADARQEAVEAIKDRIARQRERLAKRSDAWWKAYTAYVKDGGEARPWFAATGRQ